MKEREIFILALQKTTPVERSAYLDQACAGNVLLRQSVEQLLHAEAGLGNFLEPPQPPVQPGIEGTIIAPISEGPGTRIGPYKLLQTIGEGGMGVVYMAEQTEPVVRRVALKIIKPGSDTRQVIARFEAERQALALMDHPCIAKVYDAGATESGRPYFVMELVKGIPITKYCDQHQLPVTERLQLFKSVCQAVQHAHQKGIIHRDLKPSNILVALHDGEPVPMIIDFGLAKAIHQRLTDKTLFTEFGQVVGTPEYMSPEQAELNQLDIDTRTDIYSLGAVLYELLTGAPPLERARLRSAAFDEMLRIIREEEPKKPSTRLSTLQQVELSSVSQHRGIDPRKLSSLFRGELDWVVMKALDKNRSRRYETANGLARDIERYLADEPVEARPPSSAYRLRKYIRRHKTGTAAAAAGMIVLLAAMTGLAVSNELISEEQQKTKSALDKSQRNEAIAKTQRLAAEQNAKDADEQRSEAERHRALADQQLYFAHMGIAHEEWENNHAARTRELLDRYLPENNNGVDLRGWEWHYLWRLSHTELRELAGSTDPEVAFEQGQTSLAFTPDGQYFLMGSNDGLLRIWSPDAMQELQRIKAHSGRVSRISVSGDGKWAATSSNDGTVRIWDIPSARLVREFASFRDKYYGMALSHDGTRLAIGDKEIVLYDARTGAELHRIQPVHDVDHLTFSRDGKRLASFLGTAQLWDAENGTLIRTFDMAGVTCGAISPDGDTVITGQHEGAVHTFDASTGNHTNYSRPHTSRVVRVVFNLKGNKFATASDDTTVHIHGKDHAGSTLCGHVEGLIDVAFAPKNNLIASCAWSDAVRIWDPESRQEATLSYTGPPRVDSIVISPTGDAVAVSGQGTIIMYEVASGREFWRTGDDVEYIGPPGVRPWGFDPSGRYFVSGNNDGHFRIRDAHSGEILKDIAAHDSPVTAVQFLLDGRLATGSGNGEIGLWSAGDYQEQTRFSAHVGRVNGFARSNDGRLFASCGGDNRDRTVRLWDAHTGSPVRTLSGYPGGVYAAVFSADSQTIFFGGEDDELHAVEVATGKLINMRRAHVGSIPGIAATPDGKRLATCSTDRTVKIWDAETLTEMLTLKPDQDKLYGIGFSPDGFRLCAGGASGRFMVWEGQPLTSAIRLEKAALAVAWKLSYEHTYKAVMLEALKTEPSVAEDVRQKAAELIATMPEKHDQLTENSALAWYLIGRAGKSTTDYERGADILRRLLAEAPDDATHQSRLALAQFRLNDLQAAETSTLKAMELNGGADPLDWILRAMFERKKGQDDKARLWLAAATEWFRMYNDETITLSGIYQEAADLLGERVAETPKNPSPTALADLLFAVEPDAAKYAAWYLWRMRQRMIAGDWNAAIPDLEYLMKRDPDDTFLPYQYAAMLARAGRKDLYEAHCRRLLEEYANSEIPMWSERAGKACLILPTTPEIIQKAGELTDRALVKGKEDGYFPYFQTAAALAHYRRGQFQKCVEIADETLGKGVYRALEPTVLVQVDDRYRQVLTLHLKAMALWQLQKFDLANATRKEGDELRKQYFDWNTNNSLLDAQWHDWAICDVLQKECDRLLAETPAATPAN